MPATTDPKTAAVVAARAAEKAAKKKAEEAKREGEAPRRHPGEGEPLPELPNPQGDDLPF